MADNPQLDTMGLPGDSIDFAFKDTPPQEKPTDDQTNEAPTSPTSSKPPTIPSLRPASENEGIATMTASSTPLGMLQNARRPRPGPSIPGGGRSSQVGRQPGGGLPTSMAEKMKAFHASRQGVPSPRPQLPTTISSPGVPASPVVDGLPGGLQLPPNMRPPPQNFVSAPVIPKMKMGGGLSARRGMKLPGGLPPAPAAAPGSESDSAPNTANGGSMFNQFAKYVDTEKGTLKFAGKAVIHGGGIDFANGTNFNMSLDEVDTLEELGKGNYGTVYKVRHARPRMRKPGLGLAGNKSSTTDTDDAEVKPGGNTTGVVMAMKELRLELDEAKFAAIIMELDILHRCLSPYIIDFYGAFFQEGAVYICIEFMDGGSIDKIYGDGIPENVLRKITYATTQGLKTLKDEHNIIHRDVKPTNILVNTKGQVKICDFGVSGNLVASIAKTNIGCQSYMAPERISGGGISQAGANPGGGTYSVQSDIWSLGLSVIECAMGRYPYPPETYNNIFSQLSAIVDGEPPDLPAEGFSPTARNFVRGCLNKIPKMRPTYSDLLQHPWLAELSKPNTISEEDEEEDEDQVDVGSLSLEDGVKQDTSNGILTGTEDSEVAEWVKNAIERKKLGLMGTHAQPALHKAPLDTVSPLPSPRE